MADKLPTTAVYWFHGRISKADAEYLVKESGGGPGTFLVRIRRNPAFKVNPDCVITVLDDTGTPSHHLLGLSHTGLYVVNGAIREPSFKSIEDVVLALSQPRKDWPVSLRTPVPITPQEASAMLHKAGLREGSYIYHSVLGSVDQFVLNVVFRGKVTHHLIERVPDGRFAINKRFYKSTRGDAPTSMSELIELLRRQHNEWPVKLTIQIFPPKWNSFTPDKPHQLPVLYRSKDTHGSSFSRQDSMASVKTADHGLLEDTDIPREGEPHFAPQDEPSAEFTAAMQASAAGVEPDSASLSSSVSNSSQGQDFSRNQSANSGNLDAIDEDSSSMSSSRDRVNTLDRRKDNIKVIRSLESNFGKKRSSGSQNRVKPPKAKFFDL